MIAAVLVPLVVLVAAVLLERYEARIAPRETARAGTDALPATAGTGRRLHVVRDAGAPAAPVRLDALPQAS